MIREVVTGFAILFVIGMLAIESLRLMRRRRLRKDSTHWPKTEAVAEKGHIADYAMPEAKTKFKLSVPYSYEVAGKRYSGWYVEEFDSLELAQLARTTLAERRLLVRYDPSSPERSWMDPYTDY